MGNIVSLTQHTTDIADFMAAGAVRKAFFFPPYPVTTTVQVAALYDSRLLVGITAIAELPEAHLRLPEKAVPMHH